MVIYGITDMKGRKDESKAYNLNDLNTQEVVTCKQLVRGVYIYVASPAGRLSSATGWARLCLSPSSGQHHTNAVPGPLRKGPQTCHIKSTAERSLAFTLTSQPPAQPRGLLDFVVLVSHQMLV